MESGPHERVGFKAMSWILGAADGGVGQTEKDIDEKLNQNTEISFILQNLIPTQVLKSLSPISFKARNVNLFDFSYVFPLYNIFF